MKALVYTGPRTLEFRQLAQPQPRSVEALVRVHACGVCGSDLFGYLGRSKKRIPPLVLGHEFSGQVEEVGVEARGVRSGDRVAVYPLVTCGECRFCRSGRHHICRTRKVYSLDFHGALAEYVTAPHDCLFKLPDSMTYLEGALVEPLANAIHVVEKCGEVKGHTGVIFGAGSIGLLIYWYARHLGAARLAVVDRNGHRLDALKRMGADLTIDVSRQKATDVIAEWTGGAGAEFTVDAVGISACRESALACTGLGGASVWIGLEEDMTELSGLAIVNREIDVRGSYAYSRDDFAKAIDLLGRKLVPTESFVTSVKLDDGKQVFEELIDPHCTMIKAVFDGM